jgi:excisionase family DNA binding protein
MDLKLVTTEAMEELNQKLDTILLKLNEKIYPKESEWMDVNEVCQALKISKRSIFNYISQGHLGFSHLTGQKKLYFKREDVNKMISNHYVKPYRTK